MAGVKAGGTIVEATAGNTGLGLALVGGTQGLPYRARRAQQTGTREILHCKAMGAEVGPRARTLAWATPTITKTSPGHHRSVRLVRSSSINSPIPLTRKPTRPQPVRKFFARCIDAIVVGVGSGGTLSGIGCFMAKHWAATRMIFADPVGSVLAQFVESGRVGKAGSWAVEGIGEDFIPPNAHLSLVHKAYAISDPDSFAAARDLLRHEGCLYFFDWDFTRRGVALL